MIAWHYAIFDLVYIVIGYCHREDTCACIEKNVVRRVGQHLKWL